MRWEARTNSLGKRFRQWHASAKDNGETPPEWPTDEQVECPICGAEYESRYLNVKGEWVPTPRQHIYHDLKMHTEYERTEGVKADDLRAPREPGE